MQVRASFDVDPNGVGPCLGEVLDEKFGRFDHEMYVEG